MAEGKAAVPTLARAPRQRQRPAWVWVISIWYAISPTWTLLSLYLVRSGFIPIAPASKAYFDSLTVFDYALSITVGVLNLSAAVALFLLRKQAFPLFSIVLAINIMFVSWHIATKGAIAVIGGTGLFGVVIGNGILLAVCIYSRHLAKAGVLT